MRPSEQLRELLAGRIAWDDAHPAIRSVASRDIFKAAKMIIAAPDKSTRRKMLLKVPAKIRPQVEAEITRQWAAGMGG